MMHPPRKNQQQQHGKNNLLLVNLNHKNINDDELNSEIESKLRKLLKFGLGISVFQIHAQNNHLSDHSISFIAKHLQLASTSTKQSPKNAHKKQQPTEIKIDLNLSSNELQGKTIHELFGVLENIPSARIKALNLSWNQLSDENVMTKIGRFISVLNSHSKSNKPAKKKEHSTDYNCIKTLNLSKNGIECHALAALCRSCEDLKSISTLLLYDNNIVGYPGLYMLHENGIRLLSEILMKDDCTLTELNIANNKIGSSGAVFIAAALRKNTSLKILNIRNNEIELSGIRSLCEALFENKTLESLDLSSNNYLLHRELTGEHRTVRKNSIWCVHDEGLFALSKMLARNSTITYLNLSQEASEQDQLLLDWRYNSENWGYIFLFESLRSNRSLKHLDLRGNNRIQTTSLKQLYNCINLYNTTLEIIQLPEVVDTKYLNSILSLLNSHKRRINNEVKNVKSKSKLSNIAKQAKSRERREIIPSPKPVLYTPNGTMMSDRIFEDAETQSNLGALEILPPEMFRVIMSFLLPGELLRLERLNRILCNFIRYSDDVWKMQCRAFPNLINEDDLKQTSNYRLLLQNEYLNRNNLLLTISQCSIREIPLNHYQRIPTDLGRHVLYRVSDLQFISLNKLPRQNIKPIAFYSHQYGILGVIHNQSLLPRIIHEVDYLFSDRATTYRQQDEHGIVDQTIRVSTISHSKYQSISAPPIQIHVKKKYLDRAWIHFIADYRFKRKTVY
jgi:hypothetical protein